MSIIILTRNQMAIVSAEDHEYLQQYNWCLHNPPHSLNNLYAIRNRTLTHDNKNRGTVRMHRAIMERMLGRELEEEEHVDHIDGNGLNNQRENLQLCTRSQNQLKRQRNQNNKSGVKGVFWEQSGQRWRTYIDINKRRHNLYSGPDFFEAVCQRKRFELLQNIPKGTE